MKTTFLAIAILALMLANFGCDNSERGYQLHVRFDEPQQLKIGDPVVMQGDPIGRVESILSDLLGPGYVVTMQIMRSKTVKLDATVISPSQRSVILVDGSPHARAAVHDNYLAVARAVVITTKPRFEKQNYFMPPLSDTNRSYEIIKLVLSDANRSYALDWGLQYLPPQLDTNRVYTFTIEQRQHKLSTFPWLCKVQLEGQTLYDVEVCQVHHTKMGNKDVPILYGLPELPSDEPTAETRRRLFPHRSELVLGGCGVSEHSPKTTKIYVCAECKSAYEKWKEEKKNTK